MFVSIAAIVFTVRQTNCQSFITIAKIAILSGPAIERIKNSVIKEVVLLDTIPVPEDKMIDKFTILPVAPLFADAIERIYADKPVSPLYTK